MQEKLRDYIEKLFEDAPKTVKAAELKEEILQNLLDKYNDLLGEGKSEEAAFNLAVANIGDVSELIEQLKKENSDKKIENDKNSEKLEEEKRKSALLVSAAVMLYIICVVPIFIFQNELGVILMFVLIGVATAMLIYNDRMKPKYNKLDDTLVEEFKEWSAKNSKDNQARKHINSALWSIIVAIYFIVSFSTGDWYITWILFVVGGAIEEIIKAVFELKK